MPTSNLADQLLGDPVRLKTFVFECNDLRSCFRFPVKLTHSKN